MPFIWLDCRGFDTEGVSVMQDTPARAEQLYFPLFRMTLGTLYTEELHVILCTLTCEDEPGESQWTAAAEKYEA